MAAGIGLVIKIAAETRQAVGDIKDVNKALEGTGAQTGKTGRAMGMLKSSALPVLGGIAVAAVGAAAAMVEFGKAAWEDHQEAEKLASVLKTIPGITQRMIDSNEDWIATTMFATHVVDTDLRQGISDLVLVTNDLTKAQKYATAAADVATVANVSYDTAVTAVQKALMGKGRALLALAPQLDKNKDGTLSLAEAQGILTDETLKGQAAAKAAQDPWTTIGLIWDELKESLGQWLIPLFTRLGNWFKDPQNQKKIQEFIDRIGDLSYQLGMKLMPYLEDFLNWLASPQFKIAMAKTVAAFQVMGSVIAGVARAVKWLVEQFQKLKPFSTSLKPGSASLSMGYSSSTVVAPYAATPARAVTVNFYGTVTDPEATARAVSRTLRGSDWRNGRTRSLEPAW